MVAASTLMAVPVWQSTASWWHKAASSAYRTWRCVLGMGDVAMGADPEGLTSRPVTRTGQAFLCCLVTSLIWECLLHVSTFATTRVALPTGDWPFSTFFWLHTLKTAWLSDQWQPLGQHHCSSSPKRYALKGAKYFLAATHRPSWVIIPSPTLTVLPPPPAPPPPPGCDSHCRP
jgi:hypothetical protein